MSQDKRTFKEVERNTREYQSRSDVLKKQIAELKLHFESEIKRCGDPQKEALYISSAKTLEEMERMIMESESGVSQAQEEHKVWQENAYVFLV